jgi:Protein of unknown function (DUF448)
VVRTPAGVVTIDATGRMPGRGAYLCRDAACWDTAARKRALEHALKTTIPADVTATLASSPGAAATTATTTELTPRVTGAHLVAEPSAPPAFEGGAHGQE